MGILDRLFAGKVVRDFGLLNEVSMGIGKRKLSLLLAERDGQTRLVFKSSAVSFLGGGVSYVEVPEHALPKLAQCVTETRDYLAARATEAGT